MCFGLPMRIVHSDGLLAKCEGAGRSETISLAMTGELPIGQIVLVHLGTAIRTLTPREANDIENAMEAITAAIEGRDFDHLIQDLVDRKPELPPGLHPNTTPGSDKS